MFYRAILDEESDPTLSDEVKNRIHELKRIRADLVKNGDKYEELSNIRNIIKAYRSHKLEIVPGKVTYWSHGKMLHDEPEVFDLGDFQDLNHEFEGYKGFWVEGVRF